MAEKQKQPFYRKKLFIVIAALIIIGAIFGPKDADKKDISEPVQLEGKQVEETNKEIEAENPYEKIANFAFGEDVKCDVIEIQDENNNPKVTRINITDSGETNLDPFLGDVFTYLKKIKEENLDYESVFFILRAKKQMVKNIHMQK